MSRLQRESRFDRSDDVIVMKFGGTSVEDAAAIRRLIGIVQSRAQSRLGALPVVVVSALARVTDQLLGAGNASVRGQLGAALDLVRAMYVRHEQLADELVAGSAQRTLEGELRAEFRALEHFLHELDEERNRDLPVLAPKSQDRLLCFGECLAGKLVSAALAEAGVGAAYVDARACIVTDSRHGQANPIWDATNQRLQDALSPQLESRLVPVLGGFIAADCDGVPTTLGRGGSDFTAAIVGAALGATCVEIWTDVDGVMTTDPKLCPEAQVIRKMSFEEAAELARCGAKVLHPATLAPAMRENIPVYVLNSRQPLGIGTEISARSRTGDYVSAITVKRNVTAVEIEARHAVDSKLLHAVYAAFDRHGCAVEWMAASAGCVSLVMVSTPNLPAIAADLHGVANLRWESHRALVSLVGENTRRQPELASRALAAVSDMGVRVLCQGASEGTISFLVDESKVAEAVQRLHGVFFPRPEVARDWGGSSSAFCQAGLG
jgi:aspartate kinase